LFGGLEGVDVTGLDLIQNGGTGVLGLADPVQLPGSSRAMSESTRSLATLHAPVPRVSDQSPPPAALSGGLEVLLRRVDHWGGTPGFHGQVGDLGAYHKLVGGRDGFGVVALSVAALNLQRATVR